MTANIEELKELIARAVDTQDVCDVADASHAIQKACTAHTAPEVVQLLVGVVSNAAAPSRLRASAIQGLSHSSTSTTDSATLRAVARCLDQSNPADVAGAAAQFLSTTNTGGCPLAAVSDELTAVAASSESAALRVVECVLDGLQSAHAAEWRADATAQTVLARLPGLLASDDIAVALNAIELVDSNDGGRWGDAENDALTGEVVAKLQHLAASPDVFSLVRVAAVRALGGVAARGVHSLAAVVHAGAVEMLQSMLADSENEALVIAAMGAIAKTAHTLGVVGVRALVERCPTLLDAVIAADDSAAASNAVHMMAMHALADVISGPGTTDTEDGSSLMRTLVFDKLRPSSAAVVSDCTKMCCSTSQERACAGTHMLVALAQHKWGADALLADTAVAGVLLARDHTFFGVQERFVLAKAIIKQRPDFERACPELGRLARQGPGYREAQPVVAVDQRGA